MFETVGNMRWPAQNNTSTDETDLFASALAGQTKQDTAPASQNWFFNNHHTKNVARRTIAQTYETLYETSAILHYYNQPSRMAQLPKGTDWPQVFTRVEHWMNKTRRKLNKYNSLSGSGMSRKEYAEKLSRKAISASASISIARDYLVPLRPRPVIVAPISRPDPTFL